MRQLGGGGGEVGVEFISLSSILYVLSSYNA